MIKDTANSAIQLHNSLGTNLFLLLVIIACSAAFFAYMFKYLEKKDDRYEKQQDRWIAEFKNLINDSRESNKEMAVALKENTQALHKLTTSMEVGFSKLKINIHD